MTIRIFVGCAAEDAESCCVLEHTLRKHASQELAITWMRLSKDPMSPFFSDKERGWRTYTWTTPFSAFRWAIPELCGFEGKAIYMDSDIIVRADIAKLWEQEFQPGKAVMAKAGKTWRFCVSLWECAAAKAHVRPLAYLRSHPGAHQEMIARFKGASFVQQFKDQWNYCDNEDKTPIDDPSVKAIHYTDIATQPSTRFAIPRLKAEGRSHWYDGPLRPHPRPEIVALFDQEFVEAKAAGFTPEKYNAPSFDLRKRSLKGYQSRHRKAA